MSWDRYFNYAATPQLVLNPLENKVVGANQEVCRLLQMDTLQVLAMPCSQLFSPSLPHLVVFTQELLENGRGWCNNLLIKSAQDEIRVEVTGRCTEAGDEVLLFLSLQPAEQLARMREQSDAQQHYLSGIGHWNQVSRVFQEFERENQLLLDAAGEGIYGVDVNGITTFLNPAAERILGYTAAELAGRNMHTTVHHSHSDGSHFSVKQCPIFAAFHDGAVHTVEDDVFWTKQGTPIDVEYTSTPVTDNGFIVGAVVVFRDVSQKKADQRRLLEALKEVESLKNRLEMEKAYLQEEIKSEFNQHQIIGKSQPVQRILEQIQLVAPTASTVLINGESGTGKELVARAIHELSPRSSRALIRVNCAAIPEELFESEFFGHVKGAFTGAIKDRPGRFELADGGTLFLDEVGEIPLHLQGKLLRVLQEQQFERVGETRTRHVNVRIITATNRNLLQLVKEGRFREDLYFRLNVFPIVSPPLRERLQDIPLLTQHFLQKACTRANKMALKIPLSELEKLQQYHWPGNIRELENVIERQVILCQGDVVRFGHLDSALTDSNPTSVTSSGKQIPTATDLREQGRRAIILALEQSGGRISGAGGAAEILALKPTTLASRIKKLQIDPRQFRKKSALTPVS
ncbi:sigma 54-interacting transcriptional regulator [Neptuniibacter sp. CAU 1671]|uniref:sigma-54 interaction domain-containing protein n=1 Tax=Neptuniibacter sp. CAU 1671 TaxID=3032593 RepID=UPI0023DBA7A4|nr:sigma 54-interacting transcriptional regulator [Neptuniibacter sp. CAU 1671]MDF2180938.1 sigma 54-interacting transcriptional regulator [Neptuniibacter sp. CAU 1671]